MRNMRHVITTEIVIDGQIRPASDGAVYDLFNPVPSGELVGHAAAVPRDDMNAGGEVPNDAPYQEGGHFQKPALVSDANPDLKTVREEQIDPSLPIMMFKTENDAARAANASDYGRLVRAEDAEKAVRLARRIEAQAAHVNGQGPMAQDGRGPFGGFKQSGTGRNLGFDGVLHSRSRIRCLRQRGS